MASSSRPALPIPPPLRGLERHTFTYRSIVERLPRIARRVLETNDYPPSVTARLEALIADIPDEPIRLLRDAAAPDTEEWVLYVSPYLDQSWLEVPWFFAETYFYRRVLEATSYFGRQAEDDRDPFGPQKAESLTAHRDEVQRQARRLAEMREGGWPQGLRPWLALALWGNQGDLSMWPGGADEQPDPGGAELSSFLLVDDTEAAVDFLRPGSRRVDFLMDNAGLELVSDLILVDVLLSSGSAQEIWLHVKNYPLFVSDALARDVRETVATLAGSDDDTRMLGERLRGYLQSGQVLLRPHRFWTSPCRAGDAARPAGDLAKRISLARATPASAAAGRPALGFQRPAAAVLACFPGAAAAVADAEIARRRGHSAGPHRRSPGARPELDGIRALGSDPARHLTALFPIQPVSCILVPCCQQRTNVFIEEQKMEIQGNAFIVAGGGSGLGAATARRLAGQGAMVVIGDINEEAGSAIADSLGDRGRFHQTDVTDPTSVEQLVALAQNTGPLRGAINCAGIAIAMKVLGREGPHDLGAFSRVIQVNLIGTFNVIRLAAAAMTENEPNAAGERGVIVNTASVAAIEGQIGQAAYSASKGGVAAMTLPVARELARYGIRVMTIAPGIFDTPMLAGLPEKARQSLGEQVPFPSRLGDPDEYALLVQHIVENPMLNGEIIRLDGALRMGPR